jgi:hypothetical protein
MAVASEVQAADYPLFGSNDTLDIVLEVPMKTLLRTAKKNPVLAGKLHYDDAGDSEVTLDIEITTRGKSRLKLCSLPPLSISVNRKQAAGTLFDGQKKLKIGTRCKKSSAFERYLYQEYSIYRAYNLLTDYSFRVRMLNVTYRDAENKRKDEVMPAYFIESDREVAERHGMKTIKIKRIKPSQLNPAETSIYELFQYLIGNTDWSILKGPSGEECCHNGKVIGLEGSDGDWVILPYDFDQAGLIDTNYALPADALPIRNVTQRLYRGRCRHNGYLDDTVALFNERRSELEAVLLPAVLTERYKRATGDFLEDFFSMINDPEELQDEIVGKCRGRR